MRLVYSHLINPKPYRIALNKRVIIIGAGTTGEFICRELLNDSRYRMEPIGFLDDNKNLHGQFIHNKKVEGSVSILSTLLMNMMKQLFAAQMHQGENYIKLLIYVKKQVSHFELFPQLMK